MPTLFSTDFSANILPSVVQRSSPNCVFSRIAAEFTSPLDFTMEMNIAKNENQPVLVPVIGDQFLTDTRLITASGSVDWFIQSEFITYDGSSSIVTLKIDSQRSHINDVHPTGTVTLVILPDSTRCTVVGKISSAPTLPATNGSSPLPTAAFGPFSSIREVLVNKSYTEVYLETHLKAIPTFDVPRFNLHFTDHRLTGQLIIDHILRSENSFFDIKIHFADTESTFAADLVVNAVVDKDGLVSGILVPPSNISDNTLTSFVTGSWKCDRLTLNFDLGRVLEDCFLNIPNYSTTVQGTIQVEN